MPMSMSSMPKAHRMGVGFSLSSLDHRFILVSSSPTRETRIPPLSIWRLSLEKSDTTMLGHE